jgi:hypothetical protein
MEALEIEGQTDQAPLESFGQFTAQGELAEAQLCWLLGTSVRTVDGFAFDSFIFLAALGLHR